MQVRREHKKLKILQTVQKDLALIGYNAQAQPFNGKQIKHGFKSILGNFLQLVYLIRIAKTPSELMVSVFMAGVATLVFISFVSTVQKMPKIFYLIDEIEKIINKRLKHPEARTTYENTNRLAEKCSKIIYFLIVKISVPSLVLPKAAFGYFLYFTTDANRDAFELSIPVWLPFNYKSLWAYPFAISVQFFAVYMPLRYIECFVSLGVTIFLFSLSLAKDIGNFVRAIDESARAKKHREIICKQISKMIQFTNLQGYLRVFSEIFEITFLVLFMGCTVCIALALLMIQMELVHTNDASDPAMLFEAAFCGFWAIALVYIVCESGQQFSNAFANFEYILGQLDWYLFPPDIQQTLAVIIVNAQQPVEISCFGSITCNRETFKQVVNTAYSYFMIFHKFDKL